MNQKKRKKKTMKKRAAQAGLEETLEASAVAPFSRGLLICWLKG